jgi:hypothetical protein
MREAQWRHKIKIFTRSQGLVVGFFKLKIRPEQEENNKTKNLQSEIELRTKLWRGEDRFFFFFWFLLCWKVKQETYLCRINMDTQHKMVIAFSSSSSKKKKKVKKPR